MRDRRAVWLAALMLPCLGMTGCGGSGDGGARADRAGSPACDDAITASSPGAPGRPGDDPRLVLVGSGDTWFMGTKGFRWRDSVERRGGRYATKIGVYTLDLRPPAITVRLLDGEGSGAARFLPTSAGLPGPLPAQLTFPTAGCWEVTARGTSGTAAIRIRVEDRRTTD